MQNVDDLQDERKVYRTTTDLESISEQSQWVTIKPLYLGIITMMIDRR